MFCFYPPPKKTQQQQHQQQNMAGTPIMPIVIAVELFHVLVCVCVCVCLFVV